MITIPKRMRHLPRDRRGYPIPKSVLIDRNGRPHFTINDDVVRLKQLVEKRCPICGAKLTGKQWFVGGPQSAFNEHGAYIDLPMHYECAHYALQACPYLAAPNYSGRINAATLSDDDDTMRVLLDQTMIPDRPPLFVAVQCRTHQITLNGYLQPMRPYLRVEYWQHGKRLDDAEGEAQTKDYMTVPLPARQPMRIIVR
jgi:hypothetical protein